MAANPKASHGTLAAEAARGKTIFDRWETISLFRSVSCSGSLIEDECGKENVYFMSKTAFLFGKMELIF